MTLDLRRRVRVALFVVVVCVVALVVLTVALGTVSAVREVDASARVALRVSGGGVSRVVLRVLSAPGQRGVLWPALAVLAAVLARRERSWRLVLLVAGAFVAVGVSALGMKVGIGRTAPRSGRDLLFAGGRSYPSGHAVNEVVGLVLIVVLLARTGPRWSRRRCWVTGAAVSLLVVVGGASLVAEEFHWASDVLAGWLLGGTLVGCGWALGLGCGWWRRDGRLRQVRR